MNRKLLFILLGVIFTLGITFVLSWTVAMNQTLSAKITITPITHEWICLSADYDKAIESRLHRQFGFILLITDLIPISSQKKTQIYEQLMHRVMLSIRPTLAKRFSSPASFRLTSSSGKTIPIVDSGFWINALQACIVHPILPGQPHSLRDAQVRYFAFLKVAHPFKDGQTFSVNIEGTPPFRSTFSANSWSPAIKVNQVGYMPNASKKYAYVGFWLGDRGKLDIRQWLGQPFYLINRQTKCVDYTGVISPRFPLGDPFNDMCIQSSGLMAPITGEDVAQLDFSSFSGSGTYMIVIPGIGQSWDFRISQDVVNEAFYIHARGLYHQRCGIAKKKPFSNWTLGDIHKTYQGGFDPDDRHYKSQDGPYGFRNDEGSARTVDHFKVIRETATKRILPHVSGGWHDAADFDRRPYHFSVVQDLLAAYLLYPDHFSDGQLNLPESGNGIPDLVDEATWGMEVWRKAQNPAGGVGCWIEATSHPQNPNPGKDPQAYYLAWPTIQSTLEYAAYAALLARVYHLINEKTPLPLAKQRAEEYQASAIRAYEYSNDPKNAVVRFWRIGSKSNSYIENPSWRSNTMRFKAALNLYALSGDKKWVNIMTQNEAGNRDGYYFDVHNMHWKTNPFSLIEILLSKQEFPLYFNAYKNRVLQIADQLVMDQSIQAYRNLNVSPQSKKFSNLAWGGSNNYNHGRALIAAMAITQQSDPIKSNLYREAALLAVDWQNGANPLGQSWTTGLGRNYPTTPLHLSSSSDGITDPIPGITIFGITGQNSTNGRKLVYSLDYGHISLLPQRLYLGNPNPNDQAIKKILTQTVPLYRRYTSLGGLEVAQNEFTVWETIAPAAAFTGCLMSNGWMPSYSLKTKKPLDKGFLQGRLMLP